MISDRTRTIIIFVVTTVWAVNFAAGLVLPAYKPSESINGIFMAIVGGLFALGARSNNKTPEPPPPALPPAPMPPETESKP
jgi:hypothetical protein